MAEPINTDKLEVLKNSILQQPIFNGLSLPTISDDMILEITAGGEQCKTAIADLVSGITGTSLKEDFNNLAADGGFADGVLESIESCISGKRNKPLWETDGHYSTVYLVALTLGLDDNLAKDLARYAEQPDTYIHSEIDFELNQTWSYPWEQANTHALSNGFHGVEEMLTSINFLQTPQNNKEELGRLLHRFGDTYAHTDFNESDDWGSLEDISLYDHLEPWLKYVNNGIKVEGMLFFKNEDLQKRYLNGKTFSEYLRDVYLKHESDKFKMYGENLYGIIPVTFQHFMTPEKSKPDYIWARPKCYLQYVKNLAALLSIKYSISKSFEIETFTKMVDFAKRRPCKLKGIIDYEIEKKRNKRDYFIIPVFYSVPNMIVASVDAVTQTDYLKEAQVAKENTIAYLRQVEAIVDISVEEIKGTVKINENCIFDTLAYKIKFK